MGELASLGTPTPDAVVDDLEKVVSSLSRFRGLPLLALRGLPSVQLWMPGPTSVLTDAARSNAAMQAAIARGIGQLAYDADRRSLEDLFDFANPDVPLKERQARAAQHQSSTKDAESFRRSRQALLLRLLADEIFRDELAWCMKQLAPAQSGAHPQRRPWAELLEMERSVDVDAANPQRQTWHTKLLLKCVSLGPSIYTTPQRWSGRGTPEPGDFRMLSEQEARQPHQLLRVRPEHSSPTAMLLYIFDLGAPRAVGQEIEVEYEQILIDSEDEFVPLIGVSTRPHPLLRRIEMSCRVPGIESVDAVEFAPAGSPSESTYGDHPYAELNSLEVNTAKDGWRSCKVTTVTNGNRYEMWWGDVDRSWRNIR